MDERDKAIVRCWSAVVASGSDGAPFDVAEEMRKRGLEPSVNLWKQMRDLRVRGALP